MTQSSRTERGAQIVDQYSKLKDARAPLNETYRDAYAYTYPVRGAAFNTGTLDGVSNATSARSQMATRFDASTADSVRLLASSIFSSLTPSALNYFGLSLIHANVEEEDMATDAKEWLEDASEKLHQLIHASNYDGIALEFFEDIVIAGQAGLYVELNRNGELQFEQWPLYSMFGKDTYRTGRIDSVYRLLQLTAAQAVDRFGLKNVSDAVKSQYDADPHNIKTFEFVHCIRPRIKSDGKLSQGKLKTNMPFESLYVDLKTKELVMESGYEELPVIIPRWKRIPDTDSAFGPIYDVLPDIKMINRIHEMLLQSTDISINGIWKAYNDGVCNPSAINLTGGSVVAVSSMDNFQPLTVAGDIKVATAEIARLQAQIRRALLADQLGPAEKQNMTATEIQTRTQIIRQVLGPIFSRLQAEFLQPLITRCFGLCYRSGQLGNPPESLKGQIFNIVYRTPLSRDQRRMDLDAMTSFEQSLFALLQAGKTEIMDLYDMDAAMRKKAGLLNVDVSLIRDEAAVRKIRKERADAQAAQQQQEQQMQMLAQQPASPEGV